MHRTNHDPDAKADRRLLTLPRGWLLLLAVTVWPCLVVLFHGVLPWAISGMTRRVGWTEQHPGWWNWTGIVLVGLGTMVALWFWFVHVRQSAVPKQVELKWTPNYLLTDGPYRYSRNPMYLAVLVLWIGWSAFYGSWLVLAVTFLWWLLMNLLIIPREERGLEAEHQERYRQYAKNVSRWFQPSKLFE